MRRGDLLIIAERAAELLPRSKLQALLGDMVVLEWLPESATPPSLLDEVRAFHAAGSAGQYYQRIDGSAKSGTQQSAGTDAFSAELGRLVGRCVQAAKRGPWPPVREALELLFDLLRRIDEGNDDVLFFSDEGGSHEVFWDWRSAFCAYFRCLSKLVSAEEYARTVHRVIAEFAEWDRAVHTATALRTADAGQAAALRNIVPAART